jgi:hypothetical protein
MRTTVPECSSVSRPTPPNAFTPEYLEEVRGQNDTLTATEAELAGPWKVERVPGRPGLVAVLRQWECLEAGDEPFALFWHEEQARRCAAILPAVGRESLFALDDHLAPEGYPLVHLYGDQGSASLRLAHTEPPRGCRGAPLSPKPSPAAPPTSPRLPPLPGEARSTRSGGSWRNRRRQHQPAPRLIGNLSTGRGAGAHR